MNYLFDLSLCVTKFGTSDSTINALLLRRSRMVYDASDKETFRAADGRAVQHTSAIGIVLLLFTPKIVFFAGVAAQGQSATSPVLAVRELERDILPGTFGSAVPSEPLPQYFVASASSDRLYRSCLLVGRHSLHAVYSRGYAVGFRFCGEPSQEKAHHIQRRRSGGGNTKSFGCRMVAVVPPKTQKVMRELGAARCSLYTHP